MNKINKNDYKPAKRHAVLTTGEVIKMLRELKPAGSPPPETVPVLTSICPARPAPTVTWTMIGLPVEAAAITDDVVQVTVRTLIPHVQPLPVADVGVRPAGNGSVSVTVPLVALVPTLRGVRVKYPVLLDTPKLAGVCVFARARSEADPGSSAKLLLADTLFAPTRLISEIAEGVTPARVAVPPVLPAVVIPLVVPVGCRGWVTV